MSAIGLDSEVAEAVAVKLVTLGFIEAVDTHYPLPTEEELESLLIYVVPAGDVATKVSRGGNKHEIKVSVIVTQLLKDPRSRDQFNVPHQKKVDIQALFDGEGAMRDAKMAGASYVGIANDPPFNDEHLRTNNQYTAEITLTYVGFK
ncbi:MAG: hypothetical protein COA78_24765 [Blastopirellula sp.]|nr:MAG: hypothetical protein COA78_24765 [Blastopirellula sp.]